MQTDTPFGCKHVPENNFASNIVKKVVLAYVIRKKNQNTHGKWVKICVILRFGTPSPYSVFECTSMGLYSWKITKNTILITLYHISFMERYTQPLHYCT